MSNNNHELLVKAAIYSLAFLWIFTGLTSMFFSPETGYEILARANIKATLADISVHTGAVLDIILGVWLLTAKHIRLCCLTQILVIAIYTVLLTLIDASLWLHPFGPITKNFTVVVLIAFVYASNYKISHKPKD